MATRTYTRRDKVLTLKDASIALGQGPNYFSQRRIRWKDRARFPDPVCYERGHPCYEFGALIDWLGAAKKPVGRPSLVA